MEPLVAVGGTARALIDLHADILQQKQTCLQPAALSSAACVEAAASLQAGLPWKQKGERRCQDRAGAVWPELKVSVEGTAADKKTLSGRKVASGGSEINVRYLPCERELPVLLLFDVQSSSECNTVGRSTSCSHPQTRGRGLRSPADQPSLSVCRWCEWLSLPPTCWAWSLERRWVFLGDPQTSTSGPASGSPASSTSAGGSGLSDSTLQNLRAKKRKERNRHF